MFYQPTILAGKKPPENVLSHVHSKRIEAVACETEHASDSQLLVHEHAQIFVYMITDFTQKPVYVQLKIEMMVKSLARFVSQGTALILFG